MNQSPWVTEQEASIQLGVDEKTLRSWRDIGYLKPGTHWKNSNVKDKNSIKSSVFYHIRWSKEVIEYWKEHDAPVGQLAA